MVTDGILDALKVGDLALEPSPKPRANSPVKAQVSWSGHGSGRERKWCHVGRQNARNKNLKMLAVGVVC